jgi:arginine utilization regulatory protein
MAINLRLGEVGARDLLEGIPQGIILIDPDEVVKYANKFARSFSVQSKVEERMLLKCFPFFARSSSRQGVSTAEINGSLHYLRVSKSRVAYQAGYTLISFIDETAQRALLQSNNELRQVITLYENILDSIDEGILAIDNEGKILFMNSTEEKLDNLKLSEVKGCILTTKYQLDESTSLLLKIVKTGNRLPRQPQYYLTGGGHAVNIITSCAPLFDKNEITGAVSISQDFNVTMNLFEQVQSTRIKERRDASGLEKKAKHSNADNGTRYSFNHIIGENREFRRSLEAARKAADTDSNVLIYGQTGTGKELFAQSIHNASARAKEPFVAINCAALPESLLESILFGTVKGAFTGAVDRMGLFEQADRGTLFLDEINSMPLFLQSKLLRVLQEGRVRRIGSNTEIDTSPRLISSTNIEPDKAVFSKLLRDDLYYRLAVVPINIPPLRERKDDIPLLTSHFVQNYNQKMNKNVRQVEEEVLALFMSYGWPGNVRELQHMIEAAMNMITRAETCITTDALPKKMSQAGRTASPVSTGKVDSGTVGAQNPLIKTLKDFERKEIIETLSATGGNISQCARLLGMSRQNLQYKIRKYRISP